MRNSSGLQCFLICIAVGGVLGGLLVMSYVLLKREVDQTMAVAKELEKDLTPPAPKKAVELGGKECAEFRTKARTHLALLKEWCEYTDKELEKQETGEYQSEVINASLITTLEERCTSAVYEMSRCNGAALVQPVKDPLSEMERIKVKLYDLRHHQGQCCLIHCPKCEEWGGVIARYRELGGED